MIPEGPGATLFKTDRHRGYSLIEILIAIVIFTIGIIAIMYLFPFGVKDINRSKELTAATFLGQAKMEEALLIDYDPTDLPLHNEGDFGSDYPGLTYSMDCSRFKNGLSLIHISVKVFKYGKERPLISLDTLKSTGGNRENNR